MFLSRQWLLAAGLLVVIWSGVAVVMRLTEDAVSSPEKVLELIQEPEWKSLGQTERRDRLGTVIMNLNRLTFDQRGDLRDEESGALERFVESLSDDEKKRFVDETVAPRFEAIIKGLDAMPEEERERFIARLRKDFKERPPPGMPEEFRMADEATFREVMDKDLRSGFRDASTTEKLKLAPVLEDIQRRLQGFGRR